MFLRCKLLCDEEFFALLGSIITCGIALAQSFEKNATLNISHFVFVYPYFWMFLCNVLYMLCVDVTWTLTQGNNPGRKSSCTPLPPTNEHS